MRGGLKQNVWAEEDIPRLEITSSLGARRTKMFDQYRRRMGRLEITSSLGARRTEIIKVECLGGGGRLEITSSLGARRTSLTPTTIEFL